MSADSAVNVESAASPRAITRLMPGLISAPIVWSTNRGELVTSKRTVRLAAFAGGWIMGGSKIARKVIYEK